LGWARFAAECGSSGGDKSIESSAARHNIYVELQKGFAVSGNPDKTRYIYTCYTQLGVPRKIPSLVLHLHYCPALCGEISDFFSDPEGERRTPFRDPSRIAPRG